MDFETNGYRFSALAIGGLQALAGHVPYSDGHERDAFAK